MSEAIVKTNGHGSLVYGTDGDNAAEVFQKMADKARRLRDSKTRAQDVKERKGKGGQMFRYVTRTAAMRWLDKNYPGWSFTVHPESFREFAGFVQVAGTLRIIECIDGKMLPREFTCYGVDEIEFKQESKDPVRLMYAKAAETDAFKRCCFSIGAFTDVYTDFVAKEEVMLASVTEEDCRWFVEEIVPILNHEAADESVNYSFAQAMTMTKSFYEGKITRESICSIYRKKGYNV